MVFVILVFHSKNSIKEEKCRITRILFNKIYFDNNDNFFE